MVVQILLPFCRLPFRFVDCSFCSAETFKLDVAPHVDFFAVACALGVIS